MPDNISTKRLVNIDDLQDRFSQFRNEGVSIDRIADHLVRDYTVDLDLLETVRLSFNQ